MGKENVLPLARVMNSMIRNYLENHHEIDMTSIIERIEALEETTKGVEETMESPGRIITDGEITYMCYPGKYPIEDTDETWGVKKIDSTDPEDIKITWADGSTDKVHAIDDFSALTFKYLV